MCKRLITFSTLILSLMLSGCATTTPNKSVANDNTVFTETNVSHFATGALIGIPIGIVVPIAILAVAVS